MLVVVAADPGHKQVDTPAPVRLELARAAFPDEPVVLDDHARTIDMLRDHPEWEGATFLLGADEYRGLPRLEGARRGAAAASGSPSAPGPGTRRAREPRAPTA